MNVKFDFSGDIVVIIGAATGIGRGTALEFAKAGATLIVCDYNEAKGKETIELAKEAGAPKAAFYPINTTDADSVAKARDAIINDFGRIDCMFINAGVSAANDQLGPPLCGIAFDDFKRVFEVNFFGTLRCLQAFEPVFIKQKAGKIVVTASISAHMLNPTMPQYSASKRAIINLVQATSKELGAFNVNINVLNPGFVYTPMYQNGGMAFKDKFPDRFATENDPESIMKKLASQSVFKRPQTPQDMANAVMWLCSDGSKEITGQELNVDSGIIRR